MANTAAIQSDNKNERKMSHWAYVVLIMQRKICGHQDVADYSLPSKQRDLLTIK